MCNMKGILHWENHSFLKITDLIRVGSPGRSIRGVPGSVPDLRKWHLKKKKAPPPIQAPLGFYSSGFDIETEPTRFSDIKGEASYPNSPWWSSVLQKILVQLGTELALPVFHAFGAWIPLDFEKYRNVGAILETNPGDGMITTDNMMATPKIDRQVLPGIFWCAKHFICPRYVGSDCPKSDAACQACDKASEPAKFQWPATASGLKNRWKSYGFPLNVGFTWL